MLLVNAFTYNHSGKTYFFIRVSNHRIYIVPDKNEKARKHDTGMKIFNAIVECYASGVDFKI